MPRYIEDILLRYTKLFPGISKTKNNQSFEYLSFLGVAFEQGKLLPTPETIPFRLTRDLVDGMGIMGIEGVFRCACAKTMQVIRNSKESISTIVEVC